MMVGKVDVCMGDYCVDVVVVGAGPAGSSAAFLLAERGFSVMLLNRSVFPRDKVCGGGLTPASVRQNTRFWVPIARGPLVASGSPKQV